MSFLDKIVDCGFLNKMENRTFMMVAEFKKGFNKGHDESFKKALLDNLEGEQKEVYRQLVENAKLTVQQLKETVGLSIDQLKVRYNLK